TSISMLPTIIVGKTRMGKSKLLHHLIHYDVEHRHSVVVIDPHFDLIRDVLQCSVPLERKSEVVFLNLADAMYPPPFNPLRMVGKGTGVGRFASILNSLYPELRELAQTSDALEIALMTVQADPEATLLDVERLFIHPSYRQRLLSSISDPVLVNFWRDYESSAASQKPIRDPILKRIRSFYRNENMRAILCHPDAIDFGTLIQEGKIILISLHVDANVISEQDQELVGALLISQLKAVAEAGEFSETACYCYVDELERFVTTSIDRVFSGASKRNLYLTTANQYLGQLTGSTLDAAMGNTGTIIAFKLGHDDVRVISPYMKPGFSSDDLLHLDAYNAAVWTGQEGKTQSAFSLKTAAPIKAPEDAAYREHEIVSESQTHMKTRQQVLDWLAARYTEQAEASDDDETMFYDRGSEGSAQ
ncbi:MAG: hypothetical protein KC519_15865, partial [Anaerolineae bacterium]|nr:hypothetical protein [Anaerolineae bacterium]